MISKQQHLSRRQGYLERWSQLQAETSSDSAVLDSAGRFGIFVQHIVETVYLESVWAQPNERTLRRAVLDDLVDLFVPPRFDLLKRLVMTSPAVLTETIADAKADRVDFHPALQPGGGRFRHFAMNAAAAEYYPPPLVNLAARTVGYDVPWRNDPTGDTKADIKANRIGRDFARFLRENAVGELSANAGVQRWVTARFRAG